MYVCMCTYIHLCICRRCPENKMILEAVPKHVTADQLTRLRLLAQGKMPTRSPRLL